MEDLYVLMSAIEDEYFVKVFHGVAVFGWGLEGVELFSLEAAEEFISESEDPLNYVTYRRFEN